MRKVIKLWGKRSKLYANKFVKLWVKDYLCYNNKVVISYGKSWEFMRLKFKMYEAKECLLRKIEYMSDKGQIWILPLQLAVLTES